MKRQESDAAAVRNLTRRVDRVEQILPTLATKLDLTAFATKEDLNAFATKEDLKAFPTRDEMREAIQEAVGQVRVLFEGQAHLIRLMADNLSAHLRRHEVLEGRVDGHDTALESPDLRVRRIEPPRARRGR